jgi:hypothetical protein
MESWRLTFEFVLAVAAAFVGGWLWALYDKSDFAARRSEASIAKRIRKLERQLDAFEVLSTKTDLKPHFGRLIYRSVMVIVMTIFAITIYLVAIIDFSTDEMKCVMGHCVSLSERSTTQLSSMLGFTGLLIAAGRQLGKIKFESDPQQHVRSLQDRIARLQKRLAAR